MRGLKHCPDSWERPRVHARCHPGRVRASRPVFGPPLALVFALVLAALACDDSTTPTGTTQRLDVIVTPDSTSVYVDSTLQLGVTVLDADGRVRTDIPLTWESSNIGVARVDESGRVTGVTPGTGRIGARADGASDVSRVTVSQAPVALSISPDAWTLVVDGRVRLSTVLIDAVGDTIEAGSTSWASSDTTVLRVDESGVVDAITLGSARIDVSRANLSASITVPVERVSFEVVEVGGTHVCALTADGTAYCWGRNDLGQLGTGQRDIDSPTPTRVRTELAFDALAAGMQHTCGLTAGGATYCWGRNDLGQLGVASGEPLSTVPVPVAGDLTFAALSAGYHHTCGLAADGSAHCWGWNLNAQLGDGSLENRAEPAQAAPGLVFTSVDAGDVHTCGVAVDGRIHCWGGNAHGQLGRGTTTAWEAEPAPVNSDSTFRAVTAGGSFTCAVDTTDRAYCWGRNNTDQLGRGTLSEHELDIRRAAPGFSFTSLGASTEHVCGHATDDTGVCWGRRWALGTSSRTRPALVGDGMGFRVLDAGYLYTSCGVATDGLTYCWGLNHELKLGDAGVREGGGSADPLEVAGQE